MACRHIGAVLDVSQNRLTSFVLTSSSNSINSNGIMMAPSSSVALARLAIRAVFASQNRLTTLDGLAVHSQTSCGSTSAIRAFGC